MKNKSLRGLHAPVMVAAVFINGATLAADGVLEINQTCATVSGCFTGDSPGFPVTINGAVGSSYRLTSNLQISADVNGIEISDSYITIDLGGFEVIGPGSCSGSSSSLDCGGTGSGVGIVSFDMLYGVTVRNGVVRNMRLDGVGIGGPGSVGIRIEDITVRHNARLGISGQDGVLARNCVAIENAGNGFDLDAGSVIERSIAIGNFGHGVEIDDEGGIVSGTTSRSNAGRGFNIVAGSKFGQDNLSSNNGSPDSCGGGVCTEHRRFYLTESLHDGANALDACTAGFHMASIWELFDVSSLRYDVVRADAQTSGDAGEGPPAAGGWSRTGNGPDSAMLPGRANCISWTSAADGVLGSQLSLWRDWEAGGTDRTSNPWYGYIVACSQNARVWCVED